MSAESRNVDRDKCKAESARCLPTQQTKMLDVLEDIVVPDC